jgi:hypothetical protein
LSDLYGGRQGFVKEMRVKFVLMLTVSFESLHYFKSRPKLQPVARLVEGVIGSAARHIILSPCSIPYLIQMSPVAHLSDTAPPTTYG